MNGIFSTCIDSLVRRHLPKDHQRTEEVRNALRDGFSRLQKEVNELTDELTEREDDPK